MLSLFHKQTLEIMKNVFEAVSQLNESGFHIEHVEANKFIVYDTGLFGFIEDEDPFIVDEDEILEIHETYLGSKRYN